MLIIQLERRTRSTIWDSKEPCSLHCIHEGLQSKFTYFIRTIESFEDSLTQSKRRLTIYFSQHYSVKGNPSLVISDQLGSPSARICCGQLTNQETRGRAHEARRASEARRGEARRGELIPQCLLSIKAWCWINKNSLSLRYNMPLSDLSSKCLCGEKYTVCHALSCKKEGSWRRDTMVFATYLPHLLVSGLHQRWSRTTTTTSR